MKYWTKEIESDYPRVNLVLLKVGYEVLDEGNTESDYPRVNLVLLKVG